MLSGGGSDLGKGGPHREYPLRNSIENARIIYTVVAFVFWLRLAEAAT